MHILIHYLQYNNVDISPLLLASGVDPAHCLNPSARIPWWAMYEIWCRAEQLTDDPDLGLKMVTRIRQIAGTFNGGYLLPQLLLSSNTLGEGLERVARCSPATLGLARWTFTREDGAGVLRLLLPGTPPRFFLDVLFGWLALMPSAGTATPVAPQRIHLSIASPEPAGAHTAYLGAPVTFSAGENAIFFSAEDLELPLSGANPLLCHNTERQCQEIIATVFPPGGLIEQIKALIHAELEGRPPTVDSIASTLGMSPRTLARKMASQGTSFQAITDEIRAQQAQQLLAQGLSINEISQRLGFAFPTAFNRAYHRWFGRPPSQGDATG